MKQPIRLRRLERRFVVLAGAQLLSGAALVAVDNVGGPSATRWTITRWVLVVFFLAVSAAAVAVAVPFGWEWHRWQRARRGRCARCGYDMTGNESGTCPECGATTKATS